MVKTNKVKEDKKNKVGRPTDYTLKLADKICEELALGKSMRTVCKMEDTPAMSTVFKWLRDIPEFTEQYEKAKQESTDAMAEDILDIADDSSNDVSEILRDDGSTFEKVNAENIQRARLRVDTRKWLMSKMKPKKYGDKIQQELTNPDGNLKTIVINKYGSDN